METSSTDLGQDSEGAQPGLPEPAEPCFLFADYCLWPVRRILFKGELEIPLRGREFDLLIALTDNAGTFLSNDQLIARVWPTSTVSESNLRVQIASLRRALGDNGTSGRMIVNVTGRGYSFAVPLSRDQAQPTKADSVAPMEPAKVARQTRLPTRLTGLIGRESSIEKLLIHVQHRRLLTIVGPGGIGKTSLALAVGEGCADRFDDGVFFVDLASIADATHLPSAVTKALNLRLDTREPTEEILEWLSDRSAFLILDNCEHVIDAAAEFAEAVLKRAPRVHILSTSRESLRIEDEWVHRLLPLDSPPPSDTLVTDEALAYSAIELFVERATACRDMFTMSDDDAVFVAEICRRLDGIPLAIELAAARVDRLNVRSLAALLPERLELLGPGKRTAKPHQQTLRATLDWSYQLLGTRDRTTLNRISVFKNAFTIEALNAVAGDDEIDEIALTDSLFELVGKSLVAVESTEDGDFYRLLETTRIYAGERLAQSGERRDIASRHANLCMMILRRARDDWNNRDQPNWRMAYGRWMDDVTAALDWAYSADGDVLLGIELASISVPLAVRLALIRESRELIFNAVDKARELEPPNPMLEIHVIGELCYLLQHTLGDTPELRSYADRVTELIRQMPDPSDKIEALQFDYGLRFSRADWPVSLEIADTLLDLAAKAGRDEVAAAALRMRAQACHYLGRQADAIEAGYRVLGNAARVPSTYVSNARVDVRVSTRAALGRALWLKGEFGNALEIAHEGIAIADRYRGHPLCQGIAIGAVSLAIWGGDNEAVSSYCHAIIEIATESGMEYWAKWGRNIALVTSSSPKQVAALELEPLMLDDFCTYNRHLVNAQMVERVDRGNARWCAPEVYRAYTANQLETGAVEPVQAEWRLEQALAIAQTQQALAWELRIATDFVALQARRGERAAAALIEPILARQQGGWQTADVKRAVDLLETLG